MRAFREPPALEDVREPELPPDGALVEVRATGLCRSDWHGWMGHDASIRLPHVPGHEFAGVVAEIGPEVRGIRIGDRVTAPFCCGCGACEPCRLGHTQICERDYQPGFTGWGSFAERVLVPVADLNCVALPDGLAFEAAAALGCRFMTAFAAVGERGGVRAGDWLAVHGCGGVGLSAVMLGRALGARVVAVDVAPGPSPAPPSWAPTRRSTAATRTSPLPSASSPTAARTSRSTRSAAPRPPPRRCARCAAAAATCRSACSPATSATRPCRWPS
jgi:alcohol dehydrogenase